MLLLLLLPKDNRATDNWCVCVVSFCYAVAAAVTVRVVNNAGRSLDDRHPTSQQNCTCAHCLHAAPFLRRAPLVDGRRCRSLSELAHQPGVYRDFYVFFARLFIRQLLDLQGMLPTLEAQEMRCLQKLQNSRSVSPACDSSFIRHSGRAGYPLGGC